MAILDFYRRLWTSGGSAPAVRRLLRGQHEEAVAHVFGAQDAYVRTLKSF
jgi:hypothetical protein